MGADKTFYMTYGRVRPDDLIPLIERYGIPLLTNAINRWSENTDRFLPMWCYDVPHTVDAGGYNVQSSFVTEGGNKRSGVQQDDIREELRSDAPFYPWTVTEYHEWLSEYQDEFEWATAMDYACEGRFDNLWSVDDRIEATVENTVQHLEHRPDYKVLPILQGHSVDDYVRSWRLLKERGVPTEHVGLGTVCRISSQKQIVKTEEEVRQRTDVEQIHGFGVKVSAYRMGATFDSADSAAWVSEAKNGGVYNIEHDGDGLRLVSEPMRDPNRVSDSSKRRTIHSFLSYYAYVTNMMEGTPAIDVDTLIEKQELSMDEYLSQLPSA